jgi:hypothetical protein
MKVPYFTERYNFLNRAAKSPAQLRQAANKNNNINHNLEAT